MAIQRKPARYSRARKPSRKVSYSRNTRGSANPWLAVGAALAGAAVIAAFIQMQRTEQELAINEDTLCPVAGPVAISAVLIDATDTLDPVQVASVRQLVERQIRDAAPGTLFAFGVVAEDPAERGATRALCKPRAGTDVSQMTQNVTAVQKRYDERFLGPVREILATLGTAGEANQSPIMESLQSVLTGTPEFLSFEGPKQVVLISDLLQHSEAMSFYRGEDWQSFSSSAAFGRMSENIRGADVTIYQISRPPVARIQDPAVVDDFWARYLDRQGARPPELIRVGDL